MEHLDAAPGIQYFKQTADIDLSGHDWTPFPFGGRFDGNGNTISNLTIDMPTSVYVGFFSELLPDGELTGIRLDKVDVKGKARVGGLVGEAQGKIFNSYASGSVIGSDYSIGGLVGKVTGEISNSYASVSVNVSKGFGSHVGGLVGFSVGEISNSYASGSVIASGDNIGGLVGMAQRKIFNSYASGSVIGFGDTVGGLVGDVNYSNLVFSSYYDRETTNQSDDKGKGSPRTTDEMKKGTPSESIYTGWDLAIWDFGDTTDYPTLRK